MATREKFDVLVVGAGPAGIAAACAAVYGAGPGLGAPAQDISLGIVDDNPTPGGQIWRGGKPSAGDRLASSLLQIYWKHRMARIHGTQIIAQPEPGVLLGDRDGQPVELCYKKLILATGARERFLPFPGWTLPNVMGVGGAQALVKSGLPVRGKRIVVAGSGPLLLSVAAFLEEHGAVVPLVAEQSPFDRVARFGLQLAWLSPRKLRQGIGYRWALRGSRYAIGCWPIAAAGKRKVEAVTMRSTKSTWTVPCDILACGFGLVPNLELPLLVGCEVRNGAVVVDEWQESTVPGVYCAGEITGIGGAELAVAEGGFAGFAAIGRNHILHAEWGPRARGRRFAKALASAFALRPELRNLPDDDTFVCRCEDVTHGRLKNFSDGRAAKLQTRCGMGPCQGRICGAAAEFLYGWKHESVRPPILPATLETLATEVLEKQE